MKKTVVHIIPNAHLDPVWLWDAREGLNEGVATCRTVLDLMDANPDLTFIRGEAAIYEHIRRTDPVTFARIRKMIGAGRWDPVGGSWIQPDTNLLESEVLCRHYDVGLRYFREQLGVRVRTAWQADSFGHTAGLPDVLAAGGIENFAFFRPPPETLPVSTHAFWWRGRSGARILCYRAPVGWYGCERDELPHRLVHIPGVAAKSPLRNIAVFMGLGNHGGGPSQRLVDDVRRWAREHPEFEVKFAGLHSFFDALRRELSAAKAPQIAEVTGELNFCMRGCYASVARFKHPYRRAEHELLRTERITTLLQQGRIAPNVDLDSAWRSVLFNSFHDILPGSSIERAFDEQIDEVGAVRHRARQAAFHSCNELIRRVRITLPPVPADHPKAVPFLVFNPHLRPLRTFVELEANIDHRPIGAYNKRAAELPLEVRVNGRPSAFQELATEHASFAELAWRKRVLLPITLPAAGWHVATLAWVEKPSATTHPSTATGRGDTIRNEFYRISAKVGDDGISVRHRGRALFGRRGLQLTTVADDWGSWGGMAEEPEAIRLTKRLAGWRVVRIAVTENGPMRAALVVRLESERAHADLTFRLTAGVEEVAIEARVFSDLEAARIKLVLPGARETECEVPAGTVRRQAEGEQPVLRWVRVPGRFALVSDVCAACDLESGDLRVTLNRTTRYARAEPLSQSAEWWRPAVDRGELREQFLLLPTGAPIEEAAEQLTQPPLITMAWENPTGALPATGSLASLAPTHLRVLSLKPAPAGGGADLRLQNLSSAACRAALKLGKRKIALGRIGPGEIATFRLGSRVQKVALGR